MIYIEPKTNKNVVASSSECWSSAVTLSHRLTVRHFWTYMTLTYDRSDPCRGWVRTAEWRCVSVTDCRNTGAGKNLSTMKSLRVLRVLRPLKTINRVPKLKVWSHTRTRTPIHLHTHTHIHAHAHTHTAAAVWRPVSGVDLS